jgi:hypothetical protein
MWGTLMLDIYRRDEAADVRHALEEFSASRSCSGWSTGGNPRRNS